MFEINISSWRWLFLFGLSLSFLSGCGRRSLPSTADPTVARQSLQTMLDSWQRGEPAEKLKDRTPAIVAIDDDWKAGLRLSKYQVKDPDVPHGVAVRSSVVLSLQDGSGKTFEKEATYIIGTTPKITIARSDRDDEDSATNVEAPATTRR
jgi:hypothetical protein